jgi:mono/diheme cytochrome c family protein
MTRLVAIGCLLSLTAASALGCSGEDGASSAGSGASSSTASSAGSGASSSTASSTSAGAGGSGGSDVPLAGTPIPADPQRAGDPEAGYSALVNEGYVSCGVPWSAFSQVFGAAPEELRLPGRTGRNAELAYQFTSTTTASGVEIVAPNCLSCHAGFILGQLVVGLGAADGDFSSDTAAQASIVGAFLSDEAEIAEWEKWQSRVKAIGPHIRTTTIGPNPADNLAAALFAHRDPETLAWSDDPLMELPPTDVVPVDVPPWWRMSKKNAMFYNASGRKDHARIMMTASTLCTDSVPEAQAIDAYFPDVRAYIESIEAPVYPLAVDAALAEQGREVFEATCSRCHGTYGDDGQYPNLLIDLDEIGTDATLAAGASQFAGRFVDWFNASFYGQIAELDPQPGYVAPPLDGVWATAPFLHNGSVPTVAALLDSAARPAYWTRSFDSNDYDAAALGWVYESLPAGQDAEPSAGKRKKIYDTTKPGYSNAGHTYGDVLTPSDRAAVIEYLKTL